ncbi:MAG TPA: nucleotidyltransferase domain-containing protein [Candidatus Limnocylindrales bacterium]|nr:nucleotidyltransferase domain-containing protein [Candidatus Limnocylindrales bacterium]
MPDAAETEYAALLDRARADPSVVGVVVYGSRAAGPFVTPESDVDCFVIVDGSIDVARRWRTPHGAPVEVWPMTIDAFRVHALPGDAFAWNRPALIRARVDLDKLGGEIGRIVDRKRRLRDDEAREAAAFELDGAINSLHRALRSAENGRDLAARLDAQEAIGPLLRFAFATEGRVRPFNKWLLHELDTEPLTTPAFAELAADVDALATAPTVDRMRATFRTLETVARATGHADVIDGWEPDVAWLRGEAPYRS